MRALAPIATPGTAGASATRTTTISATNRGRRSATVLRAALLAVWRDPLATAFVCLLWMTVLAGRAHVPDLLYTGFLNSFFSSTAEDIAAAPFLLALSTLFAAVLCFQRAGPPVPIKVTRGRRVSWVLALSLLPLGVYLARAIMALLAASSNEYGLEKSAYALWIVVLVVVTYVTFVTLGRRGFDCQLVLLVTLIGGSVIYAVAGLSKLDVAEQAYQQGRFSAFGGGPNVYARIMSFGLLATIGLWLDSPFLLAAPLCIGQAACLFLSGSRGSMVAAFVAIAFLAASASPRARLRVIGLVLVAMLGMPILDVALGGRLHRDFEHRIVMNTVDDSTNLDGRQALLLDALRAAKAAPVIGGGPGAFLDATYTNYPHDLSMEMLVESGASGLMGLWVGIGLALFWLARPSFTISRTYASLGIFMFVAAHVSGDLYDSRYLWFFVAAGLARLHIARESGRLTPKGVPSAGRAGARTQVKQAPPGDEQSPETHVRSSVHPPRAVR